VVQCVTVTLSSVSSGAKIVSVLPMIRAPIADRFSRYYWRRFSLVIVYHLCSMLSMLHSRGCGKGEGVEGTELTWATLSGSGRNNLTVTEVRCLLNPDRGCCCCVRHHYDC